MNDLEDLIRDGLDRLTAESQIPDGLVGRARRRAAKRRHPMRAVAATGAAVTAAAAAAIAVTSVASTRVPSSNNHRLTARLAAWTVIKQTDGDIIVTISQLQDPVGLESTLRADGVPASVDFTNGTPSSNQTANPACSTYPGGGAVLDSIITGQLQNNNGQALTIDPSAMPSGLGLQIFSLVGSGGHFAGVGVRAVQASQQCTGS
jgi:hypothetical protein